jgi:mannosyltransferase OCH1-like enzyme
MQKIFTFGEPEAALPGYLRLCLRTWRRFLPDYEIVVLNYSNLDQWLGKDCYDASMYKNFSLPKQAYAVRCAVLKRWGGVWFDTDTFTLIEPYYAATSL